MLNEQVMGLLQNNAANPAIVKRIAEENQLSQTEIAQALKIPEEAAARYMPAQEAMPGMAPSAGAANEAARGAANAAIGGAAVAPDSGMRGSAIAPPAVGSAGGGLSAGSAGGGMSPPGGIPAAAPASPMGQMADSMQKPAAPAPANPVPKPGAMPADMKPQGMAEPVAKPMGRPPGGNPSLPRLPAFGRGRSSTATEGEQAFVNAFNRLRGNAQ